MGGLALGLEVPCCLLLAFLLLCKYGDVRKQHKAVLAATLLAWTLCFLIVATIPLDVTTTIYRQCENRISEIPTLGPNLSITTITTITTTSNNNHSFTTKTTDSSPALLCKKPWSYVPDDVLPTFWHVVYWTSQCLTWLVLPFMQSYSAAGDFSVSLKARTAILENAIYYGSYAVIFLSLLLYAVAHPSLRLTGSQLRVIGITASNTWGLLLLVLLLGYGLVAVPRARWLSGDHAESLTRALFSCSRLAADRAEAAEHLEDLIEEIKKLSDVIKYNHPLRKHINTIISKFSESVQESLRPSLDDFTDFEAETTSSTTSSATSSAALPSLKQLAKTHKQVIKAVQRQERTQGAWEVAVNQALLLDDTLASSANPARVFSHSTAGLNHRASPAWVTPSMEWWWRCRVKPVCERCLAALLCCVSLCVVWSECTFFSASPVLSLFALYIAHAERSYSYVAIEVCSLLTVAYLSVCTFSTVFRIRVFNLYHLAPHHQTNHHSLLFSGMLFCRLTPPLCLNFLGLIHIDSHISHHQRIETAYTQLMGHMDVISFMADGFYIYYPITIVAVCVATYFTLGSRILRFLGFQQFTGGDDVMAADVIAEGRDLLNREKRRRQRQEDGATRRKEWRDKYGSASSKRAGVDANNSAKPRERDDAASSSSRETRGDAGRDAATHRVSHAHGDHQGDRVELLREVEPLDFNSDDFADDPLRDRRYQPSGRYSSLSRGKNIFDDV